PHHRLSSLARPTGFHRAALCRIVCDSQSKLRGEASTGGDYSVEGKITDRPWHSRRGARGVGSPCRTERLHASAQPAWIERCFAWRFPARSAAVPIRL